MYLAHHKVETISIITAIIIIVMFAETDHKPSVKAAFELLVKALQQRQVMDEGIKESHRISEGIQQDRELCADLACKHDLRLAWLPHAPCLHGLTRSWIVCMIQ